eukprot:15471954-Alexandrium_andersonii.AAC.1
MVELRPQMSSRQPAPAPVQHLHAPDQPSSRARRPPEPYLGWCSRRGWPRIELDAPPNGACQPPGGRSARER